MKKRIALIVGHDHTSQGAYSEKFNLREYEFHKKVVSLLVYTSCFDLFYRDHIGIDGVANRLDPDKHFCSIELHFNAFNGKAEGSEVLYRGDNKIAEYLLNSYVKRFSSRNRGLKERKSGRGAHNLAVCHEALNNGPSIILEMFFGDNKNDCPNIGQYVIWLDNALFDICNNYDSIPETDNKEKILERLGHIDWQIKEIRELIR